VRVVGPDEDLGIISDIDDTVMVTALLRPLLAFWNTFVRQEGTRRPVPGMAVLFREIVRAGPDAFVVYVSTGAWNVAPVLDRFLARHDFPRGPLLMTDWGPTGEGWFRSGREHKRTQLRRLVDELPQLRWVLVGDDGQHDPLLYDEVVARAPTRVRAVVIRQLSPAEQVLTHGTPDPPSQRRGVARALRSVPVLRAPDGVGLLRALRTTTVLSAGRTPPPPR
jgi:phosphatidate phosphatase APP1